MTKQKPSNLGAGRITKGNAAPLPQVTIKPKEIANSVSTYHKALTVKLDKSRYIALKTAGIQVDKSTQEIMVAALDLWLAKNVGVASK